MYKDKTTETSPGERAGAKSQGHLTVGDHRQQNTSLKQLQRMADDRPNATTHNALQKKADHREAASDNGGLPAQLQQGIEQLSGIGMGDVNVHYNSNKPAQLNAHAYAQGTDIHIGPGQEKHLPHEAWHVVQQKQGRVQATRQMKDAVNINDDAGLEREADVMGAKAHSLGSSMPVQSFFIPNGGEQPAQMARDVAMTESHQHPKDAALQCKLYANEHVIQAHSVTPGGVVVTQLDSGGWREWFQKNRALAVNLLLVGEALVTIANGLYQLHHLNDEESHGTDSEHAKQNAIYTLSIGASKLVRAIIGFASMCLDRGKPDDKKGPSSLNKGFTGVLRLGEGILTTLTGYNKNDNTALLVFGWTKIVRSIGRLGEAFLKALVKEDWPRTAAFSDRVMHVLGLVEATASVVSGVESGGIPGAASDYVGGSKALRTGVNLTTNEIKRSKGGQTPDLGSSLVDNENPPPNYSKEHSIQIDHVDEDSD